MIAKHALLILSLVVCGCAHDPMCDDGCWDGPSSLGLGKINRAHYDVMQTNGEAADFVISENEFFDGAAEPNSAGQQHIIEIAARMAQTPFPIIVEPSRSGNGALDGERRELVVRVLTHLGNQDAAQRTMVMRPYSDGVRPAGFRRFQE